MRERRLSERRKALYKQRKEKIEKSFADSKNNHEYRYAMYKGIEKIKIINGLFMLRKI